MRHAPTAPSRLRRALVLAPLLLALVLSLWCAARPTEALARSAAGAPRPGAPARGLPASTARGGGSGSSNGTGGTVGDTEDHSSALAPILVGLLLTGIASYKHRGLPRGH